MAELDGVWRVDRVSGLLPPLLAVRKVIRGSHGETRLGRVAGVPFVVEGSTLRYLAPLDGFVDVLEPDGSGGFNGRATFRGRDYGRFRMLPDQREEKTMSLTDQLTKHIDEAIAMEQTVLRMLDSLISTTPDDEIREELRLHKLETERHQDRLRARLEAHGASPSLVREGVGMVEGLMKSVLDVARPDKAGRNARDAFATEHLEIASYELLERVARMAGDEETAAVARENRADEQAMVEKLNRHWDRFAELSLRDAGVSA